MTDTHSLMSSGALLAGLVAADYAGVLVAMLADLRSGVAKARRSGATVTSRGFRSTVEKAGRYYLTLFAMTAIDLMIVAAVLFLREFTDWNIPPFPIFTTVGAIGLGLIELKSIMENTRSSTSLRSAGRMLKKLFEDPEIRKIAEKLLRIDK
ncbi:MAG: hypothetical protein HFJ94_05290 [Muribaculaceae bacterium]|nr:hypothetical protein [Muribaculaceae bacterium]